MPFSSRYSQRLPPSPGSTSNSPFRQSRVLWEMCTRLHGSERPGPGAQGPSAGGRQTPGEAPHPLEPQRYVHEAGRRRSQAAQSPEGGEERGRPPSTLS